MLDEGEALRVAVTYLEELAASWPKSVAIMPEQAFVRGHELVVPWDSTDFIEGNEEAELTGNSPIAVDLETGRCRELSFDECLAIWGRKPPQRERRRRQGESNQAVVDGSPWMNWVLQAVIGPAVAVSADGALTRAVTVEVGCGLRLMPMTPEVYREVTGEDWSVEVFGRVGDTGPENLYGGFFPVGFERVLARWSVAGPVAYVETEHLGGFAVETATVWRDGAVVLGPLSWDNGSVEPGGDAIAATVTPVVAALRELGVRASEDADEIRAAGLDRVPYTEDWAELGVADDGSMKE